MRCYACDRAIQGQKFGVYTEDGQLQFVGVDCFSRVQEGRALGYRPPKGGPWLYLRNFVDLPGVGTDKA